MFNEYFSERKTLVGIRLWNPVGTRTFSESWGVESWGKEKWTALFKDAKENDIVLHGHSSTKTLDKDYESLKTLFTFFH